ncbi:SMI1/KNR4 family protein [Archangium violaceum]|nr:SMI1/KNR4 family protein [Archangium violaceum]QRK13599.1 SMI1/KNR4 family protein [Archangium violaceum]
MDVLLEEVSRQHFPNPPATLHQIEDFERRAGWRLDPDLRAFYSHCDGARLFKRDDEIYQILPLSKIIRARVAILGRDLDEYGPSSWYAICDTGDTDYVAVDTSKTANGRYPLLDCFHETFTEPGSNKLIALSFSDFLEQALRSDGHLYWLKEGWTPLAPRV